MRRIAGSKRSPTRGTRCARVPAIGAMGEAAGQERADAHGEALPRRAARRRRSSSAAARSRRGTATPGCSRASRPATRWSSSRIRARSCRSRSPCAIAREVLAEAGFDPNVVTLVAHDAGDDTAQQLALRPEGARSSTSPAAPRTAAGSRSMRARRRSTRRRRASTRSSSIRRDDFKGVRAQPRVLARALHRADVHGAAEHLRAAGRHRHRRKATSRSTRSRRRSPTACASCSAIPRARWRSSGAVQNDGVLRRLEAARSLGKVRARHARVAHPAVSRRRTIRTPLIVKLDARRSRDVSSTNGSARSPS